MNKYEKLKKVICKDCITIRLADVLLVMGDDIEFFKERNHLIFRKCIGDNSFEELCKWNLKKDLDNQSQSTKDFLTKLLVK